MKSILLFTLFLTTYSFADCDLNKGCPNIQLGMSLHEIKAANDSVLSFERHIGEGEFETAFRAVHKDYGSISFLLDSEGKCNFLELTEENKGAKAVFHGVLRIGSPAELLQELNQGDFAFSGFDWDYQGWAANWQNGRLSRGQCDIAIQFLPDEKAPEIIGNQFVGDGQFQFSAIQPYSANITVRTIRLQKKQPNR